MRSRSRPTLAHLLSVSISAAIATAAWAEAPLPADAAAEPPALPELLAEPPPPLELDTTDLATLDRGEVVVRAVKVSDDERWAEAVMLFDALPTEIFHIITDPPTQVRLFRELEHYEITEEHEDGLSTYGIANVSMFIPNFEYWLRTRHDPLRRWNAWAQTRGDFDANDGYWRFVYDEERGKTIASMRLHFALKGVLALVPEWIIVRLQSASMPKSLALVQEEVLRIRSEEPELHEQRVAEWKTLIDRGVLEEPLLRIHDAGAEE